MIPALNALFWIVFRLSKNSNTKKNCRLPNECNLLPCKTIKNFNLLSCPMLMRCDKGLECMGQTYGVKRAEYITICYSSTQMLCCLTCVCFKNLPICTVVRNLKLVHCGKNRTPVLTSRVFHVIAKFALEIEIRRRKVGLTCD